MSKFLKSNFLFFLFLVCDSLVVLAHFLLKNKYGFFELDGEQNLNSTYSGLKLMLIATLAVIQFLIAWRIKEKKFKIIIWGLAALSFIYLGLDEMVALHERVGFVMNNLTGLTGFKGASFNWVIYYSPLIILALVVYARLLFMLWQEEKTAFIFTLIGAGLLVMALAAELIGGKIVYPAGVLTRDFHLYFIFIIIEEAFELLGATFFLAGVFKKVSRSFSQCFEIKTQNG